MFLRSASEKLGKYNKKNHKFCMLWENETSNVIYMHLSSLIILQHCRLFNILIPLKSVLV
jgi:hypothetical protein